MRDEKQSVGFGTPRMLLTSSCAYHCFLKFYDFCLSLDLQFKISVVHLIKVLSNLNSDGQLLLKGDESLKCHETFTNSFAAFL